LRIDATSNEAPSSLTSLLSRNNSRSVQLSLAARTCANAVALRSNRRACSRRDSGERAIDSTRARARAQAQRRRRRQRRSRLDIAPRVRTRCFRSPRGASRGRSHRLDRRWFRRDSAPRDDAATAGVARVANRRGAQLRPHRSHDCRLGQAPRGMRNCQTAPTSQWRRVLRRQARCHRGAPPGERCRFARRGGRVRRRHRQSARLSRDPVFRDEARRGGVRRGGDGGQWR
jgi:hypothetical protein